MPRRPSNRDLAELTALAFLLQGQRHPYELHRLIVDTHKDYLSGLPRSLYHAIDRLVSDELIQPVETSREGRRPERTVYEITPEGRAELATRMKQLLARPDSDSQILGAVVSLMGCLPPQEVVNALRTREVALETAIVSLDANRRNQQEAGLPRLLMLEMECEQTLRSAELEWVRGVIEDLRTGELAWRSALADRDLGPAAALAGRNPAEHDDQQDDDSDSSEEP